MLQDVLILETVYPCWAYALTRIGKSELFTPDWLKNDMLRLLQKLKNQTLSKGTLLVWKNHNCERIYSPVSIEGNEIISEEINYAYHAGVYEGGGLVSDMVKTDGDFDLPFIIRKRKLEQLSPPEYFLRFGRD